MLPGHVGPLTTHCPALRQARESFAAQQPPEVRIMKHMLALEDPAERRAALGEAFTPGAQVATATQDFLTTCAALPRQ